MSQLWGQSRASWTPPVLLLATSQPRQLQPSPTTIPSFWDSQIQMESQKAPCSMGHSDGKALCSPI